MLNLNNSNNEWIRKKQYNKETHIKKEFYFQVPKWESTLSNIYTKNRENGSEYFHESRTIHTPREALLTIAEGPVLFRKEDTRITPETESVRHYFRGMKYGTWA